LYARAASLKSIHLPKHHRKRIISLIDSNTVFFPTQHPAYQHRPLTSILDLYQQTP
jgi:hypothetical protein